MNIKKLQLLISAGIFSAALLSGTAYAKDSTADAKANVQVSTGAKKTSGKPGDKDKKENKDKKEKTSDKSAAHHDCASSGGCAGK